MTEGIPGVLEVVLDTNVLVSALLTPAGVCARVIDAVIDGRLLPLVSPEILEEYGEVLLRPKLGFDHRQVEDLITLLLEAGRPVTVHPLHLVEGTVPDPDDLPFIQVAQVAPAFAVVTGNRADFPADLGIRVLSPAELLALLPSKTVP